MAVVGLLACAGSEHPAEMRGMWVRRDPLGRSAALDTLVLGADGAALFHARGRTDTLRWRIVNGDRGARLLCLETGQPGEARCQSVRVEGELLMLGEFGGAPLETYTRAPHVADDRP